jgi:hypothetical protein
MRDWKAELASSVETMVLPIMIKKKKFGRLRSIKSVEGRSGKRLKEELRRQLQPKASYEVQAARKR